MGFAPEGLKPLTRTQTIISKGIQYAKSSGLSFEKNAKKFQEEQKKYAEAEVKRIKAEAAMRKREQEKQEFIRKMEEAQESISRASTIKLYSGGGKRVKMQKKKKIDKKKPKKTNK